MKNSKIKKIMKNSKIKKIMKNSRDDESSDNYFECCGGGAGCPVVVAYESIWRYI